MILVERHFGSGALEAAAAIRGIIRSLTKEGVRFSRMAGRRKLNRSKLLMWARKQRGNWPQILSIPTSPS